MELASKFDFAALEDKRKVFLSPSVATAYLLLLLRLLKLRSRFSFSSFLHFTVGKCGEEYNKFIHSYEQQFLFSPTTHMNKQLKRMFGVLRGLRTWKKKRNIERKHQQNERRRCGGCLFLKSCRLTETLWNFATCLMSSFLSWKFVHANKKSNIKGEREWA